MTDPTATTAPASAAGAAPHITITVHGSPAPQGSKHARPIYKGRGENRVFTGRAAVEESSDKVKPWRQDVKTAALAAMEARAVMLYGGIGQVSLVRLTGAVALDVTFTFTRPKSHYRTGRNAHLLRDAAPVRPIGYPDASKILRSTEDALTEAGVWEDDSRVVDLSVAKRYANEGPDTLHIPGAVIRIWALDPQAVT